MPKASNKYQSTPPAKFDKTKYFFLEFTDDNREKFIRLWPHLTHCYRVSPGGIMVMDDLTIVKVYGTWPENRGKPIWEAIDWWAAFGRNGLWLKYPNS